MHTLFRTKECYSLEKKIMRRILFFVEKSLCKFHHCLKEIVVAKVCLDALDSLREN